jgi:uncharacterized protein
MPVILTWDESKRQANVAKHGLDFADLSEAFFEMAIIYRSRDGRFIAVGRCGKASAVTVIFRPLGHQALSIISMRPASRKERADAEKNA